MNRIWNHSKHRQQRMIVVGVILLLIIVLMLGYFYLLDWREREVNLGYARVARVDTLLAAQFFLEQHNLASQRTSTFVLLDDPESARTISDVPSALAAEDTLILIDARGMISGRRFETLWQWVQDGGTLVATLDNPFVGALQTEDELFQALGLYVEADEAEEFDIVGDIGRAFEEKSLKEMDPGEGDPPQSGLGRGD